MATLLTDKSRTKKYNYKTINLLTFRTPSTRVLISFNHL